MMRATLQIITRLLLLAALCLPFLSSFLVNSHSPLESIDNRIELSLEVEEIEINTGEWSEDASEEHSVEARFVSPAFIQSKLHEDKEPRALTRRVNSIYSPPERTSTHA